jgi:hypothetical protein
MTQDEIIEMGVQAGIHREVLMLGRNLELLADFANLVAAKEREACAKVCEDYGRAEEMQAIGNDYAAAIRARGEQA